MPPELGIPVRVFLQDPLEIWRSQLQPHTLVCLGIIIIIIIMTSFSFWPFHSMPGSSTTAQCCESLLLGITAISKGSKERKKSSSVRVVRPSLEVSKARLDEAWSSLG